MKIYSYLRVVRFLAVSISAIILTGISANAKPLPDGYQLSLDYETLLSTVKKDKCICIYLKNNEMIDDVSFTIKFPAGMTPTYNNKTIGKKTYSYVATTNLDPDRIDNEESNFNIYADEFDDRWVYNTVNEEGDAFLKSTEESLAFTIPVTLESDFDTTTIKTIEITGISIEAVDEEYDLIGTYYGSYLCYLYPNTSGTYTTSFSRAGYNTYQSGIEIWQLPDDYQVYSVKDFNINDKQNGDPVDLKYLGNTIPPLSAVIIKCPKAGECSFTVKEKGSKASINTPLLFGAPNLKYYGDNSDKCYNEDYYVLSENAGVVGFYWWGSRYCIGDVVSQYKGSVTDNWLIDAGGKGYFVKYTKQE